MKVGYFALNALIYCPNMYIQMRAFANINLKHAAVALLKRYALLVTNHINLQGHCKIYFFFKLVILNQRVIFYFDEIKFASSTFTDISSFPKESFTLKS